MENNPDKVHGNGAEIPEKEDSTATDSRGIYDTETQTNTTNSKGSEITYINVRSLIVINKCQILPDIDLKMYKFY